jgi:hypothetical protein
MDNTDLWPFSDASLGNRGDEGLWPFLNDISSIFDAQKPIPCSQDLPPPTDGRGPASEEACGRDLDPRRCGCTHRAERGSEAHWQPHPQGFMQEALQVDVPSSSTFQVEGISKAPDNHVKDHGWPNMQELNAQ